MKRTIKLIIKLPVALLWDFISFINMGKGSSALHALAKYKTENKWQKITKGIGEIKTIIDDYKKSKIK